MSGAPGVAAKEYFIKIITALSLLHVQMLFGSRFTEYRQTPTKAILATKGCLSECHEILANDAKPKVQTGFSSCFLLCLKRAKVADRQGLTVPTTFLIVKKRIRKSILKNDECQFSSPNQTLDWCPSEIKVNFGKYENTSNWYINVSWTPMDDVNETWSGILIRLALEPKDDLSSDLYCALLPKNQTVLLHENIFSYGYTYPDRIYLKVIGFPFVSDEQNISSFAPPTPPIKNRQGLTGSKTFLIEKKRIRKSILKTDECQISSKNQTLDWCPSEIKVNFGKYKNTSNWYINVSWTPMDDVNETWSGILIRLALKDSFSSDIYCALLPKNQTVPLHINISSYGYTYPDRIFLKVIGFPFVSDDYEIFPFAPPTPPVKILQATATTSSQAPVPTAVILPSVIGILIGLALVAGFIKYFLCHKRRLSLPEGFEYDAFIIYSQTDQLWVTERLLPLLEERNELKCCIHYRDFEPGKVFYDSMAECVYKSFKIIAVLSNNFFNSNYCSHELNIAKYRLLNAMDDSLIMVRIDNVDREKLPRKLQKRSFIDYFNPLERPFWEKKLLTFLDAPNDECIDKSAATLAYS
ncbi:uncharacterized protein [Montipora capricornis]|uniref:uncharacterized protein isoform X2 n=1 Tax=Montipora capricornis TaxID=246305 RepID=UPI0035F1D8A5